MRIRKLIIGLLLAITVFLLAIAWFGDEGPKPIKSGAPFAILTPANPQTDHLRANLAFLLGVEELFSIPPSQRSELNPVITGRIQANGYEIQNVFYESYPGIYVSANLYVPDADAFSLPRPTVVCPHGHWPDGKGKAGVQVQVRSIGLVRQGYTVLAYDVIGNGERNRNNLGDGHNVFSAAQASVGGPLSMGWQVYELSRAIDYLASRSDVADVSRLAVTGASGGASQTLYAAACGLDERIKVNVLVGFNVAGSQQSFGCGCEVIPLINRFIPRHNGTRSLFPLVFPTKTLFLNEVPVFGIEAVKKKYEDAGLIDHFGYYVTGGEHRDGYNRACRERMYAWLSRWLLDVEAGETIADPPGVYGGMELHTHKDLTVGIGEGLSFLELSSQLRKKLPEIDLPGSSTQWNTLFTDMRNRVRTIANLPDGNTPIQVVTELPEANPEPIRILSEDHTILLSFGNQDRQWGSWTEVLLYKPESAGPWPAMVLVNPKEHPSSNSKTYKNINDDSVISTLTDAGYAVVRLTPRMNIIPPEWKQESSADTGDPGSQLVSDFHWETAATRVLDWEGHPLFWRRVHDLAVVVTYMQNREDIRSDRVSLWGVGSGGLLAIASGAMDNRACQVVADRSRLSFNVRKNDVHPVWTYPPRILTAADIPHLSGMITPRPLIIAGAVDSTKTPYSQVDIDERLAWTRQAYLATNELTKFHTTIDFNSSAILTHLSPLCGP